MVARRFVLRHGGSEFPVDYDTADGIEVLKFQIFSLTSVLPDDQKILTDTDNLTLTDASDLASISENLRLVSIEDESVANRDSQIDKSDEELARMLQAEEEALFLQQFRAGGDGRDFELKVRPFRAGGDGRDFELKVRPYVEQVLMYEDPVRQEAARKSVPVDELEEMALVSLAKEGKFKSSKHEKDFSFLLQLLFWFKKSFSWVNSPSCDRCGSGTSNMGMGAALPSEIQFGGSRVELYRCNLCSFINRFARYTDPLKLLETRRGRCGEWANCFTLYCRAFGYKSRLILAFTDHVWTECYSDSLQRWVHLDPCEGAYENPLLYEKGWKKNLNYVIAISKDGVLDVTKRYTRKWHEVLSRRNITTESVASDILSSITTECRSRCSSEELSELKYHDLKELEELESEVRHQIDASLSLPGRQSGAIEWRIARSEFGTSENNSLVCSCPVRTCIDAHVTQIHSAAHSLLSQIIKNAISEVEVVEILVILRRFLSDLKQISFRERKSLFNLNASQFLEKLMPMIERLFSAISLKTELEDNRKLRVSLADNPVLTSLALPVALDVLDEVINNFNTTKSIGGVMKFPKLNRLSSGSVLASGEEFPLGIATSAFDGIRLSKWEEPNGGKGCWLIYKVADDCLHYLDSYDLVSANDAPERDPMAWIVEASKDGGISWNILDQQSSQFFEKRFQRKTYTIDARSMSNAFRFRFLAVRDPKATSRFQIGGIDLYTKDD